MTKDNKLPRLKIDEKWSVEYDPESNDWPTQLFRHGEKATDSVASWNNPIIAMFYALLEARRAPDAAVSVVKALEWEKHDKDGTFWTSEVTPLGEYRVSHTPRGWEASRRMFVIDTCASCDAAKAAAQADYEKRILSALATLKEGS